MFFLWLQNAKNRLDRRPVRNMPFNSGASALEYVAKHPDIAIINGTKYAVECWHEGHREWLLAFGDDTP